MDRKQIKNWNSFTKFQHQQGMWLWSMVFGPFQCDNEYRTWVALLWYKMTSISSYPSQLPSIRHTRRKHCCSWVDQNQCSDFRLSCMCKISCDKSLKQEHVWCVMEIWLGGTAKRSGPNEIGTQVSRIKTYCDNQLHYETTYTGPLRELNPGPRPP